MIGDYDVAKPRLSRDYIEDTVDPIAASLVVAEVGAWAVEDGGATG